MNAPETNLEFLLAPAEAPNTQPAAGTAPSTPAAPTKPIAGTAPNTALSKEYVQTVGRFAYLWGWTMVNSFNRRTAMSSVSEPGPDHPQ